MLSVGYCINSRVVNRPVFARIFLYLPGNTTGMENTHICRHFANLDSCACIFKGSKSNLTGFTNDNIRHWFGGKTCVFYIEVTVFSADLAPKFRCVLNNPVCNLLVCWVTYHNAPSSEARIDLISWYFPEVNTNFHDNISVCLCWGFMAQSTQWGHVERGQFT